MTIQYFDTFKLFLYIIVIFQTPYPSTFLGCLLYFGRLNLGLGGHTFSNPTFYGYLKRGKVDSKKNKR